MKLFRPKEHATTAALFFGLLVFPFIQGASALFLKEGLITWWVSRSLRIGVVQEVVAEPAPGPIAPSDDRRPFAVMIDNHPDAWPQSGIDRAETVYEVLVEGGITRLMAVFRAGDAEEIGPVRSARPYFLEYAKELDAAYAHVGGSDEALKDLHEGVYGLDDADQFRYGSYYWRDHSRYAPHNVYTSMAELRDMIDDEGWRDRADRLPPDVRSDLHPEGVPATELTVNASGASLDATFRWNPETETYDRILRRSPALTRAGVPESPATVVALEIPASPGYDPFHKGLLAIGTSGSGKATVFRDGVAIEGIWRKKDTDAQTGVYLDDGTKIPFAFGQVWYLQYAPNRGGSLEYSADGGQGT